MQSWGAAIRGDQGTDRPAQWVLKTHQVNSVFCFLLPLDKVKLRLTQPQVELEAWAELGNISLYEEV